MPKLSLKQLLEKHKEIGGLLEVYSNGKHWKARILHDSGYWYSSPITTRQACKIMEIEETK